MIATRYFDLHCDTPFECYRRKIALSYNTLAVNTGAERLFEIRKQCFAVWIRDDAENPYALYQNILKDFKEKLKNCADNLTPILTVEGGAVIEDDIGRLYGLKEDKITAVTLTWNGQNKIASGANAKGGLTEFGKSVIETMNDLGIACDLSHLNRESFFGAIRYAKYPIVTHTCCDAVNPHPRNLSDDALRLVAERGGVVGLCFYPVFLGGNDVFEAVWRHIYHILDIGLEDNLAIGSDFDGAEMEKPLSSISDIPVLYSFLGQMGLDSSVLQKIFYKNADNFFANL